MPEALLQKPYFSLLAIAASMIFNVAFAETDLVQELHNTVDRLNARFESVPYQVASLPKNLNLKIVDKDSAPSGLYQPFSRLYRDGEISIRYDRAQDPLVITHEYIHALMERQNPTGIASRQSQQRSVEEGVAQYLACSIHDTERYEFLNEMVDINEDLNYPLDYTFNTYHDSRILISTLWDLRQAVGQEKTDALLVKAMQYPMTSFNEVLLALLKSNDRYFGNWNGKLVDDVDSKTIRYSFAKHGIFEDTTKNNYAATPAQTRYLVNATAGSQVECGIQLKNTGAAPWYSPKLDRVAQVETVPRILWLTRMDGESKAYDQAQQNGKICGLREYTVKQGQTGTFALMLEAPRQKGSYSYQYQVVAYLDENTYDPAEAPAVKVGEPVTVILNVL